MLKFIGIACEPSLAWLLLRSTPAITMLRCAVLAIVLTLGIGPNASILCRAWCAGDNLPQACHPTLASPAVVAGDCCDSRVTSLTAVRSGESRQDVAAPNQESGVAQHLAAVAAIDVRLRHRPEPRRSNESLVTVLRI